MNLNKRLPWESRSSLVLGIKVDDFNVFDVDPYGLPWKIFSNLTKNFTGKAVVFLTAGNAIDIRPLSNFERECLGIPLGWENVPCSSVLFQKTIPYCLKRTSGKCECTDITLCWHESVVGHGVVGYICLFLDGSKNDVSTGGAKENEEKTSERNEGME